jgi:hypothetical protein
MKVSIAEILKKTVSSGNTLSYVKRRHYNLITLIKLPGLPQYYVNRFTPPLLQEVQIFTPG